MAPKTQRHNAMLALAAAARRVNELEHAIKHVVSQEYDDLCWMDVYRNLGQLVGVTFVPKLLPIETMMRNCRTFCAHLLVGTEDQYKTPDNWQPQPDAEGYWWRRVYPPQSGSDQTETHPFKVRSGATGFWIVAGDGFLYTHNMHGLWQRAILPLD